MPCSFVEPAGPGLLERDEEEGGGGLVRVLPVRVNANLKSLTVEELRGRKRGMHLAAFEYARKELGRELRRVLEGVGAGAAAQRLARDPFREMKLKEHVNDGGSEGLVRELGLVGEDGVVRFTLEGLVGGLERAVGAVHARHEGVSAREYAEDDEVYRGLVEEMMASVRGAVCGLRLYLEDPSKQLQDVMRLGLGALRRGYVNLRWKGMARRSGEERAAVARGLCLELGLMRGSLEEEDGDGYAPLHRAAADGAGARSLQCLVAAGADVNRAKNTGATPVWIAAQEGHAEAIEALARLGADVNRANNTGATPVYIAAQNGHAEAIEALARLNTNVKRAEENGATPVYIAAQNRARAALRC